MYRALAAELLHLAAALVATWAVFRAAIWAYPQGAATIELIGCATGVFVVVMSVPEVVKAGRRAHREG